MTQSQSANVASSVGISIVIAELTQGSRRTYAILSEHINQFNHALQMPDVHSLINLSTDVGRAMADLNRAVALAPDRPTVLLARGQVEGRRGNLAGAGRDYEAALRIDPRYAAALVNLAAIRSMQGQSAAAIELLDRAIAIDPRNPLAFYNRGYAEFALKLTYHVCSSLPVYVYPVRPHRNVTKFIIWAC